MLISFEPHVGKITENKSNTYKKYFLFNDIDFFLALSLRITIPLKISIKKLIYFMLKKCQGCSGDKVIAYKTC